jgi:hypothetical protein
MLMTEAGSSLAAWHAENTQHATNAALAYNS